MTTKLSSDHRVDPEIYEPVHWQDPPRDLSRRNFVQVLGAGLLITVSGEIALAQGRGGMGGGMGGGGGFGGRGPSTVAARLHIDRDGAVTVMTSKVEAGQGSRGTHTGRRGRTAARSRPHHPDHGRHRPDARRRHDRRQRQHAADGPLDPQRGRRRPRASARPGRPTLEGRSGGAAGPRRRDHARGHSAYDHLRRTGPGGRLRQDARPAHSRQRRLDAGPRVESARHFRPAAEPPRHRHGGTPLSVGHRSAGHAPRQGPPPARLRRYARLDRSCAGPGDGGRDRHARRHAGRLRRAHRPGSATRRRGPGRHRQMEDRAASRQQGPFLPLALCRRGVARRRAGGRSRPREKSPPRKLRGRLYSARADGAQGRRGRVGGQQAHGLDGQPEPLGRPQRGGLRAERLRGERAGDRAGHGRRVRRQAHRRNGGRSGPTGSRGQAARLRCAGLAKRSSPGPTSVRRP